MATNGFFVADKATTCAEYAARRKEAAKKRPIPSSFKRRKQRNKGNATIMGMFSLQLQQ